jgi:hypothetical protein
MCMDYYMTYDWALHLEENSFFLPQLSTITNNPTLVQQGGSKQTRSVEDTCCLASAFSCLLHLLAHLPSSFLFLFLGGAIIIS